MVLTTDVVSADAIQNAGPFALAVLQRCLSGASRFKQTRDGRESLGQVDLPALLAEPEIKQMVCSVPPRPRCASLLESVWVWVWVWVRVRNPNLG